MSLDKFINSCKRTIYNPNSTEEQISIIEYKLKKTLQYNKNYKIYILLGNLYLFRNDINQAKEYFLKAKQLNEQIPSIYNGLLKIDIIEKNYSSAKDNLEKYISLSNNKNLNLDLYRLLIDRLLNIANEYNIDDVFYHEKLKGNHLLLYLTAIKDILDENYENANNIFRELNDKIKESNISLNFNFIISLVNELDRRKKANEEFHNKLTLLKDAIWNTDTEKIKEIIFEITNKTLTETQINIILHQIPELLEIDEYEAAIKINETIKKQDEFLQYSRMTNFYDRLIAELKEIKMLKSPEKEIFQNCLQQGKECHRNSNYINALNYFKYGLQHTSINLFHYYIGKTLYYINKYNSAQQHLNIYIQHGAYKLVNSKHYISRILYHQKKHKKTGKANKAAQDAKYFSKLLGSKTYKPKKLTDNYPLSPEDKKPYALFEHNPITEEDFNSPNTFQQERIENKRRRRIPKKRRSNECNN